MYGIQVLLSTSLCNNPHTASQILTQKKGAPRKPLNRKRRTATIFFAWLHASIIRNTLTFFCFVHVHDLFVFFFHNVHAVYLSTFVCTFPASCWSMSVFTHITCEFASDILSQLLILDLHTSLTKKWKFGNLPNS